MQLDGHLLSWVSESLEESSICIYGDAEGLRSLGHAILAIAELDQESLPEGSCPSGDSFHQHFSPGANLPGADTLNLKGLTIGRVEAKGSGEIRSIFQPNTA